MCEVMVVNDDFTTMNTVIRIFETALGLRPSAAFRLMLTVHRQGRASVGVFPRARAIEVAEQIMELAGQRGEPLKAHLSAAAAPVEQPDAADERRYS
jgi:ATP-dependent Clp protease adaptor protein ClpS